MSDVILAIIVRKLVVARRKSIVISNVCKNDDERNGKKIYLKNPSPFFSLSLCLSLSIYASIFLKIILFKKSR